MRGRAPAAARAADAAFDRKRERRAADSLLEADLDRHLLVGAGTRSRPAGRRRTTEDLSEEVAEVRESALREAEPDRTRLLPVGGPAKGVEAPGGNLVHRPVGVELMPLVLVGEDRIGLLDLFEAALRIGVPRVHVGMVLARQTAVRLLDLGLVGVPLDAEDLVVVLGHPHLLIGNGSRLRRPAHAGPEPDLLQNMSDLL